LFITTHRCIGKLVYNYFRDNLNIHLNQRAFKYGCMKPDLPLNKIRFPHYKTDSFQDICIMINRLNFSPDIYANRKQLAVFSENLGIILHYIADFFCEAHNFESYNNMSYHLQYERVLSYKFEKLKTADLKHMLGRFKNNYMAEPQSSLRQYINDRHFEYLNTARAMDTDLQYSLSMCINVAYSIINASAVYGNAVKESTGIVAWIMPILQL